MPGRCSASRCRETNGMKAKPEVTSLLLVEDNPCDVEMILDALRRGGWGGGTVVARDGQEALDFLFGEGAWAGRGMSSPRLVILDLKMPRLGGLEVLQRIRRSEATRLVPVLIFTASSEERDISEAYRIGANSYVVKPLEAEKFSVALSVVGFYWLKWNTPPPSTAGGGQETGPT